MNPSLFLSALFYLTFSKVEPANILGIFPLAGRSHFIVFETLMKGLAKTGHNVDVLTHFPSDSPENPPSYNQISLVGTLPILVNNLTINTIYAFEIINFMTTVCGVITCEETFKGTAMQNLKKSQTQYDLVITELFGSDCTVGFGHLFKAPVISMISSVNLPWASDRIGNPDNPAYIPNYLVPFSDRMGFLERAYNTWMLLKAKLLFKYYSSQKSDQLAKEFFGKDLPPLEELIRNTSLIMVNSHFSMNFARPLVPNFIEIGGIHIKKPKPLSPHFQDIVTTDSKGIIYLTMGSMILTESFPKNTLQNLFDAFAELPYKILWKGTREKFDKDLTIPKNIHFEKWMPQMDILCHPNVKLFVSHGGLLGSQEAVYCGVPRLGIPLFADQENNIQTSEKMGLAIRVGYHEVTKDKILNAAKKLLEDQRYRENVERVSNQFKDRPLSPLETAIYWAEYVIRHKGAPQLRSAGADLPWFQYYLIDVGAAVLGSVLTLIYVLVLSLKKLRGAAAQDKTKSE